MQRLILALILCCTSTAFAQNAAPLLSNLVVTHDPPTRSVTFDFDVSDADGDPLDLQLRVSGDSGKTWLVALDSLVGDTGYPVTPGTGRSIVWTYNPNALAIAFGSGPIALTGRIIADDRQGVDIQDIVDQVDSARVVERLMELEGVRDWQVNAGAVQATRDTIAAWMVAAQLQEWHYNWQQSIYSGRNLVGRIPGLTREAKTWMASGHYDSVNSPGADDNASGTVGAIEAAVVLSDYHFANSLRFICFDLEEEGLLGSIHYVQNRIPAWENPAGLLNMEMIGYKDDAPNTQSLPTGFQQLFPAAYNAVAADSFRGNFLTNVANVTSNPLKTAFDSCAAAYVPDLRVISLAAPGNATIAPDLRRSDHAPFWDAGYQALMLTDGANLRNPYYHSPADTIGTLDLRFFVQNVRAVVATLAKLAEPMHADVLVGNPFVVNVPVGLAEGQEGATLTIYPNPSSGAVRFDYRGWGPGATRFRIFDSQGRLVAELEGNGGAGSVRWNGLGADGKRLAGGQYWVEMEQEGKKLTQKLALVR